MKVLGLLLRNWGGKINILRILLSLPSQVWLLLSMKLLETAAKQFQVIKLGSNFYLWVGEFALAYRAVGLKPPAEDEWGFGITIKF